MSIKRFIAKLLGIQMPVFAIFEKIDWKPNDSKLWKEFLEGDTGKKIIASMTNHEATAASMVCSKSIYNREFQAGEVSGLRMQKTMLLMMANYEEEQKSSESTVRGDQEYSPRDDQDDINNLIAEASRAPVLGE